MDTRDAHLRSEGGQDITPQVARPPAFDVKSCTVKKVNLARVNPAPYNPRVDLQPGHPVYERLRLSMQEFGLVEPLVWNQRTGNLVGGHQRLKILLEQGVTESDVVVVDLDDAREKALNLALNKITGDWDFPKLRTLMAELVELKLDLEPTGFTLTEIEQLIAGDCNLPEDEPPDPPKNPATQPGDLWLLGDHRLLCGDSTKAEDVARLMDGTKAAMVFTDPPYNVAYGESKNPKHKTREIANDKQTAAAWLEFCAAVAARLKENCQGDIYLWGASGPDGMRARLALIDAGCHWSATIIWKKDCLVLSPAKYQRIYEPCFYGWFSKSSFRGNRKQLEVWEFPRPKVSELHPTMKPVSLCGYAIGNSSEPGAVVLDLFGGSGSTLVAAELTGRRAYLVELDPAYCDVIVLRWETLTGKKAERCA